jgi:hypothetical protein
MHQNFIIPYLYEAQHVSGDTPPIIRGLKLCWQPLVFHTWKVVGRVVGIRCQAQYVPDNVHQLHMMMGDVSPETCWASYKYGIIKFWYIVASCWIFFKNCTVRHGSTNVKKWTCLSKAERNVTIVRVSTGLRERCLWNVVSPTDYLASYHTAIFVVSTVGASTLTYGWRLHSRPTSDYIIKFGQVPDKSKSEPHVTNM